MRCLRVYLLCFVLFGCHASAEETSVDQLAVEAIKHPEGLDLSLWADSTQLANPVAFHMDSHGVMYVCETFRQNQGVEDNRGHMDWLDDDLAAQTIEDRLAYFKKHLGEDIKKYAEKEDRITRLVDTDANGRVDQYSVFADGFNDVLAGTGAGVLAYNGDVFYTCIPDLWKLNDNDNDGVADKQTSLHRGYGVRVAFRGHDSHGLVMGPDGRLYFSIGDRGYSITTNEGNQLHDPASGAVFRCELDGSNLEVFATGLRNPQELAFDDMGNLFTGDNNSDGGDQARLVHVVRGSDTGWRMHYQYLSDRGPWNREKLWHPKHDGQPAYIVPPICNFADGPSGLTYYPGTGLRDSYLNTFFLCDFRGDAVMSGIRSFRLDPSGATFALGDSDQFLWNVLATDVDFGPDGAMYLTDWIEGWDGINRGRVIRVSSSEEANRSQRIAKILQQDMTSARMGRLIRMLGHADRRVRTKSQFELARRTATHQLTKVASDNNRDLAKVHAIWALGQIARTSSSAKKVSQARQTVLQRAEDGSTVVRRVALRTLDDIPAKDAVPVFTKALADSDSAVQAAAAIGISRYPNENVTNAVATLLSKNQDRDPVLRHAGIMALAGTCDAGELVALAKHDSVSVRRAAVVALRRKRSPAIAEFLKDEHLDVVVEAATAIHDLPIDDAMENLAAYVNHNLNDSDPLVRRVLNANYRIGSPEGAMRIARVLGRDDVSTSMQLEALAMLEHWSDPSDRDRVLGDWRPLGERSNTAVVRALQASLERIASCTPEVGVAAIRLATIHGIQEAIAIAQNMVADETYEPAQRAGLLQPLAKLQPKLAITLVDLGLQDASQEVRAAARNLLVEIDPDRAVDEVSKAIVSGGVNEQQAAFASLTTIDGSRAEDALRNIATSQLLAGKLPKEVQLDAVAAFKQRGLESTIRPFLDELAKRPYGEAHLATYGGDPDRGEGVFSGNVTLSCTRCHKAGRSGGRVGPNLAGLGATKTPEYLLESIVDPNKEIAKGFGTLVLVTEDGLQHQGVLQKETEEYLQLVDAEGKQFLVMKEEIIDRSTGKSAMPEGLTKELSLYDLRDLIAFLQSLKTPWEEPGGHD